MRPDLQNADCLVVGGGGFIGANLCLALRAAGANVTGLGRRSRFRPELESFAWVDADFNETARMAEATRAADIVFHLLSGALPAQSNLDPVGALQMDITPTLRLLEACRDNGVAKVVFVSSGGTVYGRTSTIPIREDASTNPISAYGITKLAIEKYLALFEYLHGLNHVILRVANPYGPFQSARRPQGIVGTILAKAIARQPIEIWGDGSVVRDFIYVEDVIEALIAATGYGGPHRIFNVGSGIGRSMLEVLEGIAAALDDIPVDVRFKEARAADVPVNILDVARIRDEMGWQPRTDWTTGLQQTAAWLRDR